MQEKDRKQSLAALQYIYILQKIGNKRPCKENRSKRAPARHNTGNITAIDKKWLRNNSNWSGMIPHFLQISGCVKKGGGTIECRRECTIFSRNRSCKTVAHMSHFYEVCKPKRYIKGISEAQNTSDQRTFALFTTISCKNGRKSWKNSRSKKMDHIFQHYFTKEDRFEKATWSKSFWVKQRETVKRCAKHIKIQSKPIEPIGYRTRGRQTFVIYAGSSKKRGKKHVLEQMQDKKSEKSKKTGKIEQKARKKLKSSTESISWK